MEVAFFIGLFSNSYMDRIEMSNLSPSVINKSQPNSVHSALHTCFLDLKKNIV